MKQLLLMRHAKSSWRDKSLSDFDRPLKRRGQKAALRMGEHLRELNLIPDHLISSTAERAHATAELVISQFPEAPELELCDDLYHALPRAIIRVVQNTDDKFDSLLLVAHNPGLEELVFQWTAEFIDFTTGAIAHFVLNIDQWASLKLETARKYENFWKPHDLEETSSDTSITPEN